VVKNDRVVINHEVANRCWRMWNGAVITWNGDVVPCCFDKDKKFVHGNIFSTQLFVVWKHPLYADFRSKILLNRKGIEMCNNCSEK
jgi:radical SAM protein with 4Fe4S-binding SPASM domain